MKLKKLKLKGIGRPFAKKAVEIDFEDLGPGLIALQGENGSGKSTVLELSGPGTIYREFVSYGESLADHVVDGVRDAGSSLSFEMAGKVYEIEVQSDPLFNGGRGKNEAYLSIDGNRIAGPGVRDVDAALAKILPDRDFFCASVFAAQGGEGSFFRLSKAQRKDMFAQMLGLAKYQAKSEAAKAEGDSEAVQVEVLQRRNLELLAKVEQVKALRSQVEAYQRRVADLRAKLVDMEAGSSERIAALEHERDQDSAKIEAQQSSLDANKTAWANAKAQLDADVKALVAYEKEIKQAEAAENYLSGLGDIEKELADAQAAEEKCREQEATARAKAEELRGLAEVEAIEIKARDEIEVQIAALRPATRIDGVDLSRDICTACPLTVRVVTARRQVEQLESELAEYASLPRQAEVGAKYKEAQRESNAAMAALTTAMAATAKAQRVATEAQSYLVQAQQLPALREKLQAQQALNGGLKATAEELSTSVQALVESIARLKAAVAATQAKIEDELKGSAEERDMREKLQQAERGLAGIEGELKAVGNPEIDLSQVQGELVKASLSLESWRLLQKAYGRDGIQALELDAAAPGVTNIANELLASCYGPRFALAMETLALKKDGGQKEAFDVRIIDSEAGCNIVRGSGGEMVIIEEALRLALAIYNAKVSGYELRTLWRDETAGALSPGNAVRYITMLRKAMELGGFHQVIFVAHSPEVWQQADTVLHVSNGTVTKG